MRRASAGLSPVRAGAALAMLASAAAIYGAGASSAFAFGNLVVDGLRYTDRAALDERLEIADGANLFQLATEPLEARLLDLPTVAGASITVQLPATVRVELQERTPLLVWRVGDRRFLVDREGALFAAVGADPGPESRSLPVLEDQRAASQSLGIGSRLEAVDLDAATRLGAIEATDVGSAAAGLALQLTDRNGFVVRARPDGWAAIFGFYTPSLRTPEMIPGQIVLLRSLLLEQGEKNVVRVVLASETDGTFSTPTPGPSTSP